MESRLIYETNKTFESKVKWTRKTNAESEWIYFDLSRVNIIECLINDFFIVGSLHVSLSRKNSYTLDKGEIFEKIKPLIGQQDIKIWNENYTKAIEISKIGVYRTGHTRS